MSTNINFDKKLGITGGTRITLPTSSTPSFSNVNSFLFDGIDEKMFSTANYTELNGTQNFSISFWIKPIDVNAGIVWRLGSQSSTNRLACLWRDNGSIDISFVTNSYYYRTTPGSVPLNQWTHIVYTYDGTQTRYNRPEIYINGVNNNGPNAGVTVNTSIFDGTLELGGTGTSGTINFGNNYIDEIAIWNSTTLTETQSNELFNNGTPTDLNNIASGLSQPTTWFRMGEEAVWNGFTWTMTDVNGGTVVRAANMQESSRTTDVPPNPFANTQSIALDGVDDEVNMDFSSTSTTGSFSVWVKPTDYTTNTQIICLYSGGGYRDLISLSQRTDGTLRVSAVDGGSTRWRLVTDNAVVSNGTWTHVVFSFDGNNGTIYINGSAVPQTYEDTTNKSWWWDDLLPNKQRLGILRVNGYSVQQRYYGNIEEQSVFTTALSSTEVSAIYNNGLPTDLTSQSNILAWYRCGDGDTAPTLTDNIGSNDGTMTNFTTFSTDVPT